MTIEERAEVNFDHPDSLDTALLVAHVEALKNSCKAEIPTYDYSTHNRTEVTKVFFPCLIFRHNKVGIILAPDFTDAVIFLLDRIAEQNYFARGDPLIFG